MRNAKLRAVMTRKGMKERLEMFSYCTAGKFGQRALHFLLQKNNSSKTRQPLKMLTKLIICVQDEHSLQESLNSTMNFASIVKCLTAN